jgi:hypothetical protein
VVRKTAPTLTVALTAEGQTVSGKVTVQAAGETITKWLVDGKATFRLGPFASIGTKTVTVDYLGNGLNNPVQKEVTVRVVR